MSKAGDKVQALHVMDSDKAVLAMESNERNKEDDIRSHYQFEMEKQHASKTKGYDVFVRNLLEDTKPEEH